MPTKSFRFSPDQFIGQDEVDFHEAKNTTAGESERKQNCNNSIDAKSISLRDDHIVLLAIDCLLALHAKLENWRHRRRTLRALAKLDQDQLRDVGLTRGKIIARSQHEA